MAELNDSRAFDLIFSNNHPRYFLYKILIPFGKLILNYTLYDSS